MENECTPLMNAKKLILVEYQKLLTSCQVLGLDETFNPVMQVSEILSYISYREQGPVCQ
jgi:hypothetical protein